jgi:hypothetical protein
MAGPGVHADFEGGGPTIQGPFSGGLQKLSVGPGQELMAVQQVGTIQRKFFFILPSLAPGKYPTKNATVTYVSYSELDRPASPPYPPPKVWQSTDDNVVIGTCPSGTLWFDIEGRGGATVLWPPALGSTGSTNNAATGEANPMRVYGLLP